jgi:hypothetical protein
MGEDDIVENRASALKHRVVAHADILKLNLFCCYGYDMSS